MKRFAAMLLVLMLALLAACGEVGYQQNVPEGVAQFDPPAAGEQIAVFETTAGRFSVRLFSELAPQNVKNFISLAEGGAYNGLTFHRVVADLLIQSGDPTGTGTGGLSSTGQPIANEFSSALHNFTGAVGMAGGEAGNESQFYIVTAASLSDEMAERMRAAGLDQALISAYQTAFGAPHLDFRYTVFGQVYEGLGVVMRIAAGETDSQHRPLKPVTIKSVTVTAYQPDTAS